MDGVSSIFAVLSLSLQLLDIVQKTSGFVRDIQDAPNELIELSETLSQLLLVLEEVHLLLQQRYTVPCLPGSPKYLLRALEGCEKKIKPLQAIIQQAKDTKRQGNRAQRTWASFKLVAKKERLRTTKGSATLPCSQQNIQVKETSIMVTPKLLRRRFEIFLNNHFGQISRTLSVYPVMSYNSWFFKMCRKGDIVAIQAALSEGVLTPLVLDEHGFTSLHWAAQGASPELCSWLIDNGVDPNRRSDYGFKAVDGLGKSPNSIRNGMIKSDDGQVLRTDPLADTLRILAQKQEELSALDLEELWYCFHGPAEDVELLFRLCSGFMEFQEEDFQLMCSHVLTKALWGYGLDDEWDELIRILINKGVDLHGRTCHAYIDEPDDCYLEDRRSKRKDRRSMNGTPLDELFKKTASPYEAEWAADNWLYALSSEGIDEVAYLEKEFELHAAQQQLTYSGRVGTTRRKLVFSFGENPTVWWEWLLDPESGAYLVREEFKAMYTLWESHQNLGSIADRQVDVSPFDYPDWSFERMPFGEPRESLPFDYVFRRLNAEARLDRRWKKKASKLARARRTKGPRKIPGAWPT